MSRSIRFRAWFKGINVMGNVVTLNGSNRNGYEGNMWDSVTAECYINERQQFYTAYNFELMAFTGLYDKTGKEIFEGDMLRWAGDDDKNFTAFEVFFHDGDSTAEYDIGYSISRTHHQGNVAGGYIPPFKPKITKQMIVIGNIFQDKHLLK